MRKNELKANEAKVKTKEVKEEMKSLDSTHTHENPISSEDEPTRQCSRLITAVRVPQSTWNVWFS